MSGCLIGSWQQDHRACTFCVVLAGLGRFEIEENWFEVLEIVRGITGSYYFDTIPLKYLLTTTTNKLYSEDFKFNRTFNVDYVSDNLRIKIKLMNNLRISEVNLNAAENIVKDTIASSSAYLIGVDGGGTGTRAVLPEANGQRREVGGWGFPASDEASGAWLGLHAVNHLQRTLDGRAPANPFSVAVLAHCGGDKNAVFSWLASANQTRYAELAPIVVRFAAENNVVQQIMLDAGKEVQAMAHALDASGELPIALCGGLAAAVAHYLPEELQQKAQKPQGDSAHGALIMIQHHLQKN